MSPPILAHASTLGIVLIAAAAISAALIAVLLPLLRRYALARPNTRSSHTVPTPQGGGMAVTAAAVATATAAILLAPPGGELQGFWTVVGATALMAVVGAIDDIRTIPVAPRLLAQAVLVGAVLTTLPGEYRVLNAVPWWLERVIFLLAGIWFVNLVNFMDGLDWMSVAEVVPVTVTLAIISAAIGLPGAAMLAAALCGAMLGFAPFNRPVAKLFLGDVGSLSIGLLLGWLLALLATRGHLAAALLLPLYYLADATITICRRLAAREQIWISHRSHFYQRATAGGWSVIAVVTRVFAVNLVLAGLAAITVVADSRAVDLVALAIGAIFVGLLLSSFARGRR